MKRVWIAGLALALGGCAGTAANIAATVLSPLVYRDYSCEELGAEAAIVARRVQELAGIEEEAGSDDAIVEVGKLLFAPTLALFEEDTYRKAELGHLRGEIAAIEQTAARKNCLAVVADLGKQRERALEAAKGPQQPE